MSGINDSKNYRKGLIKRYGWLYKKDFTVDQSKCYYCGIEKTAYDHRPAITLVVNLNITVYKKQGGKFELIPSCVGCNSTLNNKNFHNKFECLLFLFERYNKKLDKMELCEPHELKEMS